MILSDTGVHSSTRLAVSFSTMKPTLCFLFFSSPQYHTLWPSSVVYSPVPVQRISDIPMTFQLRLSSSVASNSTFPLSDSDRTSQVPTTKGFLNATLSTVANLTLPLLSALRGSAAVSIQGLDRSCMRFVCVLCNLGVTVGKI